MKRSGTATGAYNNVSDIRLKKDIKPLLSSLSKLNKLKGFNYYWKTDSSSSSLKTGVIAQEIKEIFPELVQEDEKGVLSVNYIGLIPHLVEAVKDQNQQIQTLK
ncbi:tail fiber domain-containing protein [Lacihabitans soyangensis]|uniref:Tail fiber domain-containing protein n=1 Tax=Lacihabitans soyangensis TaxID=869394 RepID=A0AAE3KUI6_9BACT|nr:tail fiber domain-containing protein [Lacihabitans soyangensis]